MARSLVLVTLGVYVFGGCAHSEVVETREKPEVVLVTKPVALVLGGKVGEDELTQNCSQTVTESTETGNILHRRYEDLSFQVRTKTIKILPNNHLKQVVETMKRHGPGSLHDLAFPELGEALDFELDGQGNIYKAGDFPKDSLFFLPAVPLPEKAVKVGDEWTEQNSWRTEGNGLPLEVELHMKLERIEKCGKHLCANVAVKGSVYLPENLAQKIKFSHEITGRFLFAQDAGLVVWSEFVSDEQMQGAKVKSRLRSELTEPRGFRTISREEPACPFETKVE